AIAACARTSGSEDFAAISSVYPAADFTSGSGTINGTVTYPFSSDGIIGLNIVARNIDNPYADAVTVMTGDWNDGEAGAVQGAGEFTLQGLTPGARYVVHVEAIYSGGFPTPQVGLPGPSEYWNGSRENDDAMRDDACDFEPIVLAAGETRSGIDIEINGVKKAPRLVINAAPDGNNVTENGQVTGGTVIDTYGEALSWIHHEGRGEYTVLPMGGIRLSDNGSMISGRVVEDGQYLPARLKPGKRIEVLPTPGNNPCDQGGGLDEYYNNFAISPDGEYMGGFLWNCDDVEGQKNFVVSAVTYSDADGWTVLNDHFDNRDARVNTLANGGAAGGWSANDVGFWEGRIWHDGAEINMKEAAPANMVDVGEIMAMNSDGTFAVGINAWDELWNQRGYTYNVQTGEFLVLDIAEPCPPWDWFCWGDKPFNPYDLADDGTMVGSFGSAGSSSAVLHNGVLGTQKMVDFLKGQGVVNANDLGVVSAANKISTSGRHIAGWTAVDGDWASFKLTLDQLWVCRNDKSLQVGYPGGVADQLARGASLGMCEADLPLQYKANY
ncbi:MAG: carboxypeptidase-like regulatory domain-containing protein, partial [Planctomycetes bacterium]|nr:carboxypeptidase-like regulatory domain-containing protein [Planctomycetota bacterium]